MFFSLLKRLDIFYIFGGTLCECTRICDPCIFPRYFIFFRFSIIIWGFCFSSASLLCMQHVLLAGKSEEKGFPRRLCSDVLMWSGDSTLPQHTIS